MRCIVGMGVLVLAAASAGAARQASGQELLEQARRALGGEALAAVRSVDASAIARDAVARAAGQSSARRSAVGDAIGVALRKARLAALRRWRKTGRTDS